MSHAGYFYLPTNDTDIDALLVLQITKAKMIGKTLTLFFLFAIPHLAVGQQQASSQVIAALQQLGKVRYDKNNDRSCILIFADTLCSQHLYRMARCKV